MPVTVKDPSARRAPSYRASAHDRCPGLLRPHEAQDGLLVRARPFGGRIGAAALRAVAGAARRGNGIVELTARANLQVRGLAAADLEPLAATFAATGLLRSATHDRVRNALADPLAGRRAGSLADAGRIDAVLDALDDALCADPRLATLPGRYLHVIDDGSGATATVDADVRLTARPDGRWEVGAGPLGTRVEADPVAAAVALARRFLAVRPPGAWRIAELPGACATPSAPAAGTAAPPLVGVLRQPDGRDAVGALAPLGRLAAETLDLLADEVGRGARARVSHRRTVALVDLEPGRAGGVLAALAASGLVVTPGTGWEGLTACAGRGACGSALADVRAAAAARAAERPADAPREHWSACPRRCGQTPEVRRAVTARPDGGWEVQA